MNTKNLKITKDGFVWLILTSGAQGIHFLYDLDIFEMYILYDDDTEQLIESHVEIYNAINNDHKIGIEVGFIRDICLGNH